LNRKQKKRQEKTKERNQCHIYSSQIIH